MTKASCKYFDLLISIPTFFLIAEFLPSAAIIKPPIACLLLSRKTCAENLPIVTVPLQLGC